MAKPERQKRPESGTTVTFRAGRPGPKGKIERNQRLYRAALEGLGEVRLGRRFGLSRQRARFIVLREKARQQEKAS